MRAMGLMLLAAVMATAVAAATDSWEVVAAADGKGAVSYFTEGGQLKAPDDVRVPPGTACDCSAPIVVEQRVHCRVPPSKKYAQCRQTGAKP